MEKTSPRTAWMENERKTMARTASSTYTQG